MSAATPWGVPPAELLGSHAATADVVVVGSGGAGLSAAAAAAREGLRTILVTKARAGRANATAWAGGGFTVSPPAGRPDVLGAAVEDGEPVADSGRPALTPDEHFRFSLDTGRGLNDRELLRALCDRGPSAITELERDFGVRVDWHRRGCSVTRFGRLPLLGGLGLTEPLLAHLRRTGTPVIEDAIVTDIVFENGQVAGVLAVVPGGPGGGPGASHPLYELLCVAAPSVVIATGGGGAIYRRTDNPPRMTGDGYFLLSGAGAALIDMEFVQFYPLGLAEPGLPAYLLDTSLLDVARLTDEDGRDPLAGKLAQWGVSSGAEINLLARDKAAVALARHVAAGHRLYLHTNEIDKERLPRGIREYLSEYSLPSFNLFERAVEVAPTQHYFCGGAAITVNGETLAGDGSVIPGLFACGEVTGGVDGANRVGGNALTNIVVFGLAAGAAAARYAKGGTRRPSTGEAAGPGAARSDTGRKSAWREARDRLVQWLGPPRATAGQGRSSHGEQGPSERGPRPADLRLELGRLCDSYIGPVRSAARLREALEKLADLGRAVEALRPATRSDILHALELRAGVATATFVARAALERTESRGAHFREDYPSEDPAWLHSVVL